MCWTAAGMAYAPVQFRPVKDRAQMPKLITALEETTQTDHATQPFTSQKPHKISSDRHRRSTRYGTPSTSRADLT